MENLGVVPHESFMPHGVCLLWNQWLVWTSAISDLLIAVAYYSIPLALYYFVKKRTDFGYRRIVSLFATFIVLCGTTHLLGAVILWKPYYYIDLAVKVATAVVSAATAVILWPFVPKLLAMPSVSQLETANRDLLREISIKTQTESQLRESEERFRMLSEVADEGIALSVDGVILDANLHYAKLLGYDRPEEMKGVRVIDSVAPEFRESVLDILQTNSEKPYQAELIRKDGSRRSYEAAGRTVTYKGQKVRISSVRDITERKRSQDALRESEEKLRGLYELSPLGIALTDMSGRYVEFNESFRRICGYPEDELRKLDYWTLTPKKYEADEARQLELLSKIGRYGPYEKEYVRKDGTLVPLRLNGVLMTGRDDKQYIWSIVEDITEKKEGEAVLIRAKIAAEESNKLKDEILSNMTHELNTPLTSVLGFSRLANERNKTIAQNLNRISEIFCSPKNFEKIVYEQGQNLFSLLSDLIDFSRLEAGNAKVEHNCVSASLLLSSIKRGCEDLAARKGLVVTTNAEDFKQNDLLFDGDNKWIEKVLNILVNNAVKFSVAGEIKISAKQNGSNVEFSVADHGIGIPQHEQELVFEVFRQGDGSNTRQFGGMGLGLAFAKKMSQMMGGNLTLISEAGKGSEFTLSIPLNPINLCQ